MSHDQGRASPSSEEFWNERVGCGEGADAIWLARHGWDVVGVDISTVALERAALHARATDPVWLSPRKE
jgi:SAM-dependent methyltransferase